MSTLSRLQDWYSRQCDGDWEHSLGVVIESCDNPGWWVKVNLKGTKLQQCSFTEIAENVDEARFAQGPQWLSCRVDENIWHGAGDENKLGRIFDLFLSWAEANGS